LVHVEIERDWEILNEKRQKEWPKNGTNSEWERDNMRQREISLDIKKWERGKLKGREKERKRERERERDRQRLFTLQSSV